MQKLYSLPKAELLCNSGSNVISIHQGVQEREQLAQLHVLTIIEPTLDRNPVVNLEPERLRGVVYDDGMAHVAPKHREVLQVVAVHAHTRVSEDAVANQAALRVQNVEQLLGVDALGRREHNHLKLLRHLLHERVQSRPPPHVDLVFLVVEVHWEGEVYLGCVVVAGWAGGAILLQAGVHQRLVQVQHQRYPRCAARLGRQQDGARELHALLQRWELLDEKVWIKLVFLFFLLLLQLEAAALVDIVNVLTRQPTCLRLQNCARLLRGFHLPQPVRRLRRLHLRLRRALARLLTPAALALLGSAQPLGVRRGTHGQPRRALHLPLRVDRLCFSFGQVLEGGGVEVTGGHGIDGVLVECSLICTLSC
mmetsp:Transcript_26149/g.49682  ORF Transcript_26149/g.49682 Transcript_26149/m.49682 type:complete len:365 (-) Transcript_26149:484-1578(-)